jgi:polyisoprenoid-binding protein YceI
MKLLFISCLFLLSSLATAQSYNLDLAKAKVTFYFHGEKVDGSLSGLKASVNIDKDKPELSSIAGSVDVSTIDTGVKMRDKHLRSKEYFDVSKYPTMTFKSLSVKKDGNGFSISGKIKIKDIEREEKFNLSILGGKLIFKGTINSADYGIMKKKKRDDSKVDITIEIPFL